jgi:hypothetical protein
MVLCALGVKNALIVLLQIVSFQLDNFSLKRHFFACFILGKGYKTFNHSNCFIDIVSR